MDRRAVLRALAAGMLATRSAASMGAANTTGRKRLGILTPNARAQALEGFTIALAPRLAELGWTEGKNLELAWRFGAGDEPRYSALAKELVDLRPDLIGTQSTPCTRALQQATRTIPIVTSVGDPVGAGFAQSLARPGSNITGTSQGARETAQKQVELMRATLPKLSTLVILRAKAAAFAEITEPMVAAARASGLVALPREIASMADVEDALRAVPGAGRGAAFLYGYVMPKQDMGVIARRAIEMRVPAIVNDPDVVVAGGLMSYRLFHEDEERRIAIIIDKLLRGAHPGLIPFELPQRSFFVINRRTAAAIGVAFPADFAIRATQVIE